MRRPEWGIVCYVLVLKIQESSMRRDDKGMEWNLLYTCPKAVKKIVKGIHFSLTPWRSYRKNMVYYIHHSLNTGDNYQEGRTVGRYD
jgi:hypothetical protein